MDNYFELTIAIIAYRIYNAKMQGRGNKRT